MAGRIKVCLAGTSWWPPVILSGWHGLVNARELDYRLPDAQPPRCSGLHEVTTDGSGKMLSYSFKKRNTIARWTEVLASSWLTHSLPDHPGKPECESRACSTSGDPLREPDPAGSKVCVSGAALGASSRFPPVTLQCPFLQPNRPASD